MTFGILAGTTNLEFIILIMDITIVESMFQNISSAGWPNRECQSSVVEFEDEELLKLENKQSVEKLKLVGNLYNPLSR